VTHSNCQVLLFLIESIETYESRIVVHNNLIEEDHHSEYVIFLVMMIVEKLQNSYLIKKNSPNRLQICSAGLLYPRSIDLIFCK